MQRAALWSGTAASYIDLHPAGATASYATGTAGGIQCGVRASGTSFATLWRGTAASAMDLHALLGTNYVWSVANGIDIHQGTLSVVGAARNGTNGREEAILWTRPVAHITSHPQSTSNCLGASASFSVSANSGIMTPTYRWRKNSVPLSDSARISGSSSPTLTITGTESTDAATYDCIVSDDLISITSSPATLTLPSASITGLGNLCPGAPASITVTTTGSPTAYQWRRNGTNLTNGGTISGATGPILTFSPAEITDAGTYDCIVSTLCGTITTSSVDTTVALVRQFPGPQSGCLGGTISISITMQGQSTSFRWYKNGSQMSSVNPSVLTSTLVLTNLTAADVANYTCRLQGTGCGNQLFTPNIPLSIISGAPSIQSSPSNALACENTAATFSVSATGPGTLSYAWRFGATPINPASNPSAATATLTIANCLPENAGLYSCIVSNACGSAPSSAAQLTVLAPSDPSCAGSSCNPDYNQDGGGDNADVFDLANDIASGTQSFPPNSPDFNNDGGGDLSDIFDLANVVAGGDCP